MFGSIERGARASAASRLGPRSRRERCNVAEDHAIVRRGSVTKRAFGHRARLRVRARDERGLPDERGHVAGERERIVRARGEELIVELALVRSHHLPRECRRRAHRTPLRSRPRHALRRHGLDGRKPRAGQLRLRPQVRAVQGVRSGDGPARLSRGVAWLRERGAGLRGRFHAGAEAAISDRDLG